MKCVAIVQARTSSSRLPGKVLLPINGKPLIIYLLERLRLSNRIDNIVLATSLDATDDKLASTVNDAGFTVFRGSLDDVLDRYTQCALQENATHVIRITGDCPFVDPRLVDELYDYFFLNDFDYVSNCADESRLSVPDGFDLEIFTVKSLLLANANAVLPSHREHVTPWLRSTDAALNWKHYLHTPSYDFYRLTVDDANDYAVACAVSSTRLATDSFLGIDQIVEFMHNNPVVSNLNANTKRNEGMVKSLEEDLHYQHHNSSDVPQGQSLWKKAKSLIPGGCMLLSKRPEMFLPTKWPSYYSSASGCHVVDLDGNTYVDMSIMGIGTNILGFANPAVDNLVIDAIHKSNMSSLNCPEEVYLAEQLVSLHPWASMVRFARTGGEANAIAVRIARAATGKDKIAICGYHGWHDWYLATNINKVSALSDHLLPGLEPAGVPRDLENTVFPFRYNNLDELLDIVCNHDLGVIKMEVQRSTPPADGFLEAIRKICDDKGIVLIFDECTSGFRETFGGLHLKYGVNPDLAIFGKALGNGFAITSVIGTSQVMSAAQSTFISSTFWTERVGPTAGLATLALMKESKSWDIITERGRYIKSKWQQLSDTHNIPISLNGLDALAGFSFDSVHHLKYKTLLTQDMLSKGFLASTTCYVSTAHTYELIDLYLEALNDTFALISRCESGHESIDDLLCTPVCHSGFSRLN